MPRWGLKVKPVLLGFKLLHFAFDPLAGRFQDDVLQEQEVVLVKDLFLTQGTNNLEIRMLLMLAVCSKHFINGITAPVTVVEEF